MTPSLTEELLPEILRDAYRYAPGIEPNRPSLNNTAPTLRTRAVQVRQRTRDFLERAAARAGFTRSHMDPEHAAAALSRILDLSPGLDKTASLLADGPSRRALIDVLKLRVLGPYHAPVRVTPDEFRAMQVEVDRTMLREPATYEVADPWFSPISRYELSTPGDASISLHAHSVDIVSVYGLEQYAYRTDGVQLAARPGAVVIDGGACWGDSALYFASLVGPEGKVYSFEFDPANLEIMRANLALNPSLAGRIEVVEKALWDVSGATLKFALGGRTTTVLPGRERNFTAESITLDDFVLAAGLPTVDFVKMDIEGAEARALTGSTETLRRHAPDLALAAYHQDDDLVRLPSAVDALERGYRFFLHTCSPVEEETVLFATARG